MRFDALCAAVRALRDNQITVDYIESNAFWCTDRGKVRERLLELRALGVDTVMASVDPFHIEFVPLERPLLLYAAARELGMGCFIWQERFVKRLMALNMRTTHSAQELQAVLGQDYAAQTAREYGLGMNGRALRLAQTLYMQKPAVQVASPRPCASMLSGRHCHVDLYGSVIPGGCPGISIPLTAYFDKSSPIRDEDAYPVAARLLRGGTAALLAYAKQLGFDERTPCCTNCDLCYRLRSFLLDRQPSHEIAPACFYRMMELA